MTEETRRELDKCVEKIRRFPKGTEFTINYSAMQCDDDRSWRSAAARSD